MGIAKWWPLVGATRAQCFLLRQTFITFEGCIQVTDTDVLALPTFNFQLAGNCICFQIKKEYSSNIIKRERLLNLSPSSRHYRRF
jgi:hypothetical protein